MPNWLREEIIKNKAVITSSNPMLRQEDLPSTEEDVSDKFSQKIDHSDSKSMDSSRSAEDDDEDEVIISIFSHVIFCNFLRTTREGDSFNCFDAAINKLCIIISSKSHVFYNL